MKRDQLDYVQFDVGFFSKPKHKALKYKFGNMSLLCLVSVLCDMGAATNAEVDTDVFYATCADYEIQNSSDLLDYLLQNGILFLAENGKLSNTRVVKDQESIANKREQWRERQNKKRDNQKKDPIVTRDKGQESRVTLNTEDLNTEDHEDLNIKKEKDKPKKEPEVLVFPEKLDNYACRQAWNAWLEHKKSRGERYKSVQSQQQKLKEWAEAPEEFIAAINFSMGNNWAGIFAKRDGKYANAPNQQRKLSPTELSIQAAQRISERINAGKTLFLEDSKK